MTSIAPPSSKKRAREADISSPMMLSQENLGFFQQPKRAREVYISSPMIPSHPNLGFQCLSQHPNMVSYTPAKAAAPGNHCCFQRQQQQPNTTTAVKDVRPCVLPVQSVASQDAVSMLYHHYEHIDTIVHHHMEHMRLGLAGAMKRQCTTLLAAAQHQAANRLREKEMEIMKINQLNGELQQKVRQLAVQSQTLLNVAKNKEAEACTLRATIQQFVDAGVAPAGEGFGERELHPAADDASSCCFGEDEKVRRWNRCRTCGEGEVCVLLLPCRHLCLCMDCESKIDTCPVCDSVKKACLQVLMP